MCDLKSLPKNVSSVLKFTFLTVTCFNGAFGLRAAFRECTAEIQHLFIQQTSLSEGQQSPRNVAERLCFQNSSLVKMEV